MSLRARLTLVMLSVLLGPLIAASVAVGVVVPGEADRRAREAASQAVKSTAAAITEQCLAVGDGAQVAALQLAAGRITGRTAQQAARRAAERRTGLQVVVLDGRGGLLASSGPVPRSQVAMQARAAQSTSCSAGTASRRWPSLAEQVPVRRAGASVATVVAWLPLTADLLQRLATQLGLADAVELSLLRDGEPVAATAPGGDSAGGESNGSVTRQRRAGPGVPFEIQATTPVGDLRRTQVTLGLVMGATALAALLVIRLLAARLTRPLDRLATVAERLGSGDLSARSGIAGRDEVARLASAFDAMAERLEGTVGELRGSRDALAETFQRFGEALGRTHDLTGLLHTVLEAACHGADAAVGSALVGTGPDGEPDAQVSAVTDGAPVSMTSALGPLQELAREAARTGGPVVRDDLPEAGPALGVPLQRGEVVIGALAIARPAGAAGFDARAMAAVSALTARAGIAVDNVRTHEEARRMSVTDPLTGAGNFRHLTTTLAREIERASRFTRPLSVIMLDLDHFKQVNDTLGHAFGDGVLREFARRVQSCVRDLDTVTRYGGEEFAIVLPETDAKAAEVVAQRVLDAVREEPFRVGRRSRRVTVSIGIACFPEHGRNPAEVMRAADRALYAAKAAGRDRWARAGGSAGAGGSSAAGGSGTAGQPVGDR